MSDLIEITEPLRALAATTPFELLVVSNDHALYDKIIAPLPFRSRYAEWRPTWFRPLAGRAAAAVIPFARNPFTASKSANRLATALASGLPVVATGIPSYRDYQDYCHLDDWENGLRHVLAEPVAERKRATDGRSRILRDFSIAAIADKWEQFLQSVIDW